MGIQFFSTFQHSHYVELAISKLKENEVVHIYAVPLDNRPMDMKLVDTMHGTDGTSLVDIGLILAMMGGTVGVSRGFVLHWGPVYWGLIGAATGFAVGFVYDLLKNRMKRKKIRTAKTTAGEVILIVQCTTEQAPFVEQTLWGNLALGVAKTQMQTTPL
ncbi:hypothetical protein FHS19_003428 [Paenibacillus rhizosphaerae]|uniref:DUF1269 domain-containing protein n=1 Tax=Paenibacillus rhizosphaerae TaxID=297318 RepID=A0A839TQG2_9BACL|nr:YqgE/AlgH family protein [Paenibacillus rhizosphaerae]MBB3128753.1 hypothetical protein [Paenibacillus rhizosphaerae]